VLAILKNIGAPANIEMQIAGESLFNDGMALTLFILFYSMTFDSPAAAWQSRPQILLREIIGGILVGAAFGWSAC